MTPAEFSARFPVLFHLASAGTWPSIATHGLLSTQNIASRHFASQVDRNQFLSEHRKQSVPLGDFLIRDQKPLGPWNLSRALEGSGLTNEDWIRLLNERVYFSPTRKRLFALWAAYADRRNLCLEVETASMLQAHSARVQISRMNAGTVKLPTHKRGAELFVPLQSYVFSQDNVAEVVVLEAVADIKQHVICAYEMGGNEAPAVLYERRNR